MIISLQIKILSTEKINLSINLIISIHQALYHLDLYQTLNFHRTVNTVQNIFEKKNKREKIDKEDKKSLEKGNLDLYLRKGKAKKKIDDTKKNSFNKEREIMIIKDQDQNIQAVIIENIMMKKMICIIKDIIRVTDMVAKGGIECSKIKETYFNLKEWRIIILTIQII